MEVLHSNLTNKKDIWWSKFYNYNTQVPADNILDAKLRAKYWGAINIICRPIIKFVLMLNCPGMQEGFDPTNPLNGPLDPKDKIVLEIAKRGINAFIYNTKTFHSFSKRRYIVTNIFGTAQA